jgi:hypothetical protein
MSLSTNEAVEELRRRLARRHHFIGWGGLLVFLSVGALLETLHGFKIGFYLDPQHKLRRELWTLGHAHGTLLALIHIAFAVGLVHFGRWNAARLRLASFFLLDALLLMPAGFFLGGLTHSESDPALGVLLVPVGAILLFCAVILVLSSARNPAKD